MFPSLHFPPACSLSLLLFLNIIVINNNSGLVSLISKEMLPPVHLPPHQQHPKEMPRGGWGGSGEGGA